MSTNLEERGKEPLSELYDSDELGAFDNGTDNDIPNDTEKLEADSFTGERGRSRGPEGEKSVRERVVSEDKEKFEKQFDIYVDDNEEINSDEIDDLIGYDDVQRLNKSEKIGGASPADGRRTKKGGSKGGNRVKETVLFEGEERFENQLDEYLEDDLGATGDEMSDVIGNEDVFDFQMDGRFDEEDAVDLGSDGIQGDLETVTGSSYNEHNDIIMTPTKEDMVLGGLVDAKPRERSRVAKSQALLSDLEEVDDVDDDELLEAAETLKSSGLLTSKADESFSADEEEEIESLTDDEKADDVLLANDGEIHTKESLIGKKISDDEGGFENLTSQDMFLQKRKSAPGYLWHLNDDCEVTVTKKGEDFSLDDTDDDDAESINYDFGGLGHVGADKESMELFEPIRKRRTPKPRFGTSMGSSKHLVEGSKEWIARKSFELLQKPNPMMMHRWVKRRYDAPKAIRDLYPPLRDTLLPHSICIVDEPAGPPELDNELLRDEASAENEEIGGFDEEGFDEEGFDEEGFDEEGFDEEGFDEGFGEEAFDEESFDEAGSVEQGLDEEDILVQMGEEGDSRKRSKTGPRKRKTGKKSGAVNDEVDNEIEE